MGNTYASLHYHVIFSTKHRERWISPAIEERIWKFLGGIARKNKLVPLQIGGVEDHIHMLIGAPTTIAPSKIAQLIKGGSSAWIHDEFPDLGDVGWQDGYGIFSVSKSNVPEVTTYIQNQREHHRTRTFQEEFREFLGQHGIEYDERYV